MNKQQAGEGAVGILTVRAYTAGGALPVQNARVTVHAADEEAPKEIHTRYTDESGLTPPLPLPAPPREASLSPRGARPYALYRVLVEKEGFYVHENREVPVFAGVSAVQGVELIPLSPYGDGRPPKGSTDQSASQALGGGQ